MIWRLAYAWPTAIRPPSSTGWPRSAARRMSSVSSGRYTTSDTHAPVAEQRRDRTRRPGGGASPSASRGRPRRAARSPRARSSGADGRDRLRREVRAHARGEILRARRRRHRTGRAATCAARQQRVRGRRAGAAAADLHDALERRLRQAGDQSVAVPHPVGVVADEALVRRTPRGSRRRRCSASGSSSSTMSRTSCLQGCVMFIAAKPGRFASARRSPTSVRAACRAR